MARRRIITYAVLTFALCCAFGLLRQSTWVGSVHLHTLMEAAATLLALVVGTMALVRFYARKSNLFLFIGTGFLGAAFLDGYHAVVTSVFFADHLPSGLPSLIPWSWVASRLFLSAFMWFSWLTWARESRLGERGRLDEGFIYVVAAVLMLVSFLFFVFTPLPRAYFPEMFFHRPEEFVPAAFFALALWGYLRKGDWRTDPFEHWLVMSLIVGLVSQVVFMSFSGELYDMMFDAAHTLKKVSYVLVLTGLVIGMYRLFQQAETSAARESHDRARLEDVNQELRESQEQYRDLFDNASDIIQSVDASGRFVYVNQAWHDLLGYTEADAERLTMAEIVHPDSLANWSALRDGMSAGDVGATVALDLVASDGRVVSVEGDIHCRFEDGQLVASRGILRDVTERNKVDELKQDFIATVSHELRTPLTAIQGALGLVVDGAAGELPESMKGLLDIAYNNGDRLVRLINDILDIEKIESGRTMFRNEPLRVADAVRGAVAANQAYATQYDVFLRFEEPTVDPWINADGDRFMQVMANLLSNAAKFSPEDSHVVVRVGSEDGTVSVQVVDRGVGIPEEARETLFDKSTQVDTRPARSQGGTGLGLSICEAIVERMHGTIDYVSEVGVGTTFEVRLPECPPPSVGQPALAPRRSDTRVLVCEDDHDVATLLARMLSEAGIDADVARDAEQATQLLASGRYHAMTLDLRLPGRGGIELLRDLRNDPATRDLPIVIVSAVADEAREELNGTALSVEDWINKPIDRERLLRAVKRATRAGEELPTLLHVEDDPDVAQVVRALLQDVANVAHVTSLREGIEAVRSEPFALVLLDVELPDGSGLDLLAHVGATPVVVFAADEVAGPIGASVAAVLVKTRTDNAGLLRAIEAAILPA